MKKNDFYDQYLSDSKKLSAPALLPPEDTPKSCTSIEQQTDELLLTLRLFDETKEQIKDIKESINQLAFYVGMPYKAKNICLGYSPALIDGTQRSCEGYIGYTVDLTTYRDNFSYIRFQACAPINSKELLRAYIIDDYGNIEAVINEDSSFYSDWTRLPISSHSRKLVATLPLNKKGVPLFTPRYVELLPNGITQKLCEVSEKVQHLSTILDYKDNLDKRSKQVEI